MKQPLLLAAALCALMPAPSFAQSAGSAQPIEITAKKTVEWLRNQKQYVAREDVIVTQGAMTLKSDLLTADYRDGAQSSMEIWQLTAAGHVQIADDANTAYGDNAVYDVTKGVAVLTGEDLRLVSPDQTVTAKDRMEYHANERKALAIGSAKVVRARDTLSADRLTAYFKDGASAAPQPQQNAAQTIPGAGGGLDRLEAAGNVVIKTPTETLYGSTATYQAASNTATLSGKVRIERGPNILEGSRAEVDLNTNISKLFGGADDGGRVRGVFFPGSEKKEGGDSKPQQLGAAPVQTNSVTIPAAPAPAAQTAPAINAPNVTETSVPPAPKISAPLPQTGDETSTAPTARPAKVSPRMEY